MKPFVRQWRATWRDTIILLNEFRWPLIFFVVAVIGGGFVYAAIADLAGEPVRGLGEAIYIVLTAAFLQPVGEFPNYFGLQIFHFLMPVVGIVTAALLLGERIAAVQIAGGAVILLGLAIVSGIIPLSIGRSRA